LDNGASLQKDLSHHRALAVDKTALDLCGHALFRDPVPAVMRPQFHRSSSNAIAGDNTTRSWMSGSGTIEVASPLPFLGL
jgi:hypothetical protein